MSIAFIFPGQGSHRAGVLSAWSEHPAARVADEVSASIGRNINEIAQDEKAGSRTADAQPAIFATSLVAWRAVTDAGLTPDVVAGHSLGEYTAAVAAGALSVTEAASVVAARGNAMGRACASDPGTMAAVVKLDPELVKELVSQIEDVVIANDNAPGQIVVAGTEEAIAAVSDAAREHRGRVINLDVEGAFHSPAMASAVSEVEKALTNAEVADPVVPLVSGARVAKVTTAATVADGLVSGVLAAVRWREVQLALAADGVTDLVEIGPGGVLAGLAKRTVPDLTVHAVAEPADIDTVVEALA